MKDFDKELSDIISERETILFEIEKVLFTKRYNLSNKHLGIFSIQSISMIYAIWEGFIQRAFQLYIEKLNNLGVEFMNFNDGITIHHMENTFKQLIEYPQKPQRKADYYTKLKFFFSEDVHELSRIINTESNVSFGVLNKLLTTFSLEPFPEFWDKYKHPNASLKDILSTFLRYRNSVSHGGDIASEETVTQIIFEKYKVLIQDLMYEIREKMLNGLKTKSYKR